MWEFEDAVARKPVVPGSRCGFLEDAEHLEAAALGEGGELDNLPFTTQDGVLNQLFI